MTVYHYCGPDAFLSILSTRTLRATHADYLNDAGEIRSGIEIARAEATSLRDSAATGPGRYYFDQVLEQIGEKASRHIFVVCFSEVSELLSQWRAYADDGHGFAIGFDFQRLSDQPSPTGRTMSGKVLYDERLLRKAIRDYLLQNAPNSASHLEPGEEEAVVADASNHSWAILGTAVLFKHHGFREEREARIAVVCHLPKEWRSLQPAPTSELTGPLFISSFDRVDEELPSCREFRVSSRGITPYLEWKFDASHVTEIRVGPRGNSNQQLTAVRMFLESNGYTHLLDKVIPSDATYR